MTIRRIFSYALIVAMIATLAVVVPRSSAIAQTERIVLIAGNDRPPSGDRAMLKLLENSGLRVDIIEDDSDLAAIDLSAVAMLVISTSVNHSVVGDFFTDVPVPILTWEAYLLDDLLIGSSVAESRATTTVEVVESSPLSAGLAGPVTVTTGSYKQTSAVAPAGAEVSATLTGDSQRATVYSVAPGEARDDDTPAPSCRTVVFPNYDGARRLTVQGESLIAAAINATLACTAPVPGGQPPVVDLGPDRSVNVGESTTIEATVTDPDPGDVLTAQWTQVSGPAGLTFDDDTNIEQVSAEFTSTGTFVIELAATDQSGLTGADTIEVHVREVPVDTDADGFLPPEDCDELDGSIYPGAPEIAGNGIDEDCDGQDQPLPPDPTDRRAVMISGTTSPPSGDRLVRDRLLAAGYEVTIVDDDSDLNALAADGLDDVDLLVIASSVKPANVGTTFKTAEVAILTWENYLFRDLSLATERLSAAAHTTIEIVDSDSALAAGLAGTPAVYTSPNPLSWGTPSGDGDVIAHVPGKPDQPVIVGYAQGDVLLGGVIAPAPRVMLFPDYNGARSLSTDGVALVDAAIGYLGQTDIGIAPSVELGEDQTITLPVTVATIAAAVVDDDAEPGELVTAQWAVVSGSDGVTFDDDTSFEGVTATFPGLGTYVIELVVTDASGLTGRDTVTLTVEEGEPTPDNEPPVVSAGERQSLDIVPVLAPGTVKLSGVASDDGLPAGEELLISWTLVSGSVTGASLASPDQAVTEVTFTRAGEYVFELSAFDGELTSTAQVEVGVSDLEDFPDAAPVTVIPQSQVFSDDPVGSLLGRHSLGIGKTIGWTQFWGPDAVIGEPGSLETTVTYSGPGVYGFALTVGGYTDYIAVLVSQPIGADAILVAGNDSPPSGDRLVLQRLIAAGFDVTIVDDDSDLGALDTSELELIVVSSSVVPSKVGNTFTDIDVPLLTWEHLLFDDLGLATSVGSSSGSSIQISDQGSSLAAELSGPTTVYTSSSTPRLSWGRIDDRADVVAHVPGEPDKAVLFSYGEYDSSFLVPAHRVGFFADYAGANRLTPDGITLLDAAIEYLQERVVTFDPRRTLVDAGPDQTITTPTLALDLEASVRVLFANWEPPPHQRWTQLSGPTGVTFTSNFRQTTATFPGPGMYTLRYSYGPVPFVGSDTVVVTVEEGEPVPDNEAPVVSAGKNHQLYIAFSEGTVTFDGSVVDDGLPTGGEVSISWTLIAGPEAGADIASPDQAVTDVTFDREGSYLFELSAHDGEFRGSAQVSVRVTDLAYDPDAVPVYASADSRVSTDDLVGRLFGQQFWGNDVTVEWSQIWGDDAVIADPTALETTVTYPGPGVYAFDLSVDGYTNGVAVLVAEPTGRDAILVAGNDSPPSGDRLVLERLVAAGFDVTIVDDDSDLEALDTSELELIVVSSSVVPSKVGDVFADTPVPLLTWEHYLFDDLGLATTVGTASSTWIQIAKSSHELAAGLSGGQTVYNAQSDLSWASFDTQADVIAHVPGDPDKAVLFAYGDIDTVGLVPAHRVGFFASYDGARRLTADGIALLDAAIEYLGTRAVVFNPEGTLVDIGPDQTIATPNLSIDFDPSIVVLLPNFEPPPSERWKQLDGPPGVVFSRDDRSETTATFPGPGVYTLRFSYSPAYGFGGSDIIVVTVE